MHIKELSIDEFTNYANNHYLNNYCQTINYALLMGEYGYEYELIGLTDDNKIYAASLILTKKLTDNILYGYAPKGFLIDYSNKELLNDFTKKITYFFKDKGFAFIKINPPIVIGEVNANTFKTDYNENYYLKTNLDSNNYHKLKDNLYFESMLPRFTGIVNLKNFNEDALTKNCRNKVKKAYRKGLKVEIKGRDFIDKYLEFINYKDDYYFKCLYNVYNKNNEIDLFLVSINYERYLINSQNLYVDESDKNILLNEQMVKISTPKNINRKMNSDRALLTYKNDIQDASKLLDENREVYIAGALVIKHDNYITIISSGYDHQYKRFVPNYYLYYQILSYYKDKYLYADLNGLAGDFSKDSPYYGLNTFKLGFKPKIYEFIGEYDLIINDKAYNYLLSNGYLAKEFNKKTN